MSGLHDHLDRAAGDPGGDHDLDLAALHERADQRRARRRAGLAGAAAVVLLAGAGLAWGAAAGPDAKQQLTAAEGGEGGGGAPGTTIAEGEPTVPPSTEVPTTPTTMVLDGEPATTVPATTVPATTVPGTTVPDATTTAPVVEDPDATFTTGGTYRGHETIRLGSGCGATIHLLEATFTFDSGEEGAYEAHYCGRISGDTFTAVGTGTLTAASGDTFDVEYEYTTPYPTDGVPYSVTITGGTGAYADASGTCDLTVSISNVGFGSQDQSGEFTCDFDVEPSTFGG